MDVGRDYTEKWHHSQQIFEATQRQSTIMSPDLFHPCLDIFLRALPFAFQKANAQEGDGIVIRVEGPAGGEWNLLRTKAGWRQTLETPEAIRATIAIHPITLWRLVTKRRSLEVILAAYPDIRIEGDRTLGECFLTMVAMMA